MKTHEGPGSASVFVSQGQSKQLLSLVFLAHELKRCFVQLLAPFYSLAAWEALAEGRNVVEAAAWQHNQQGLHGLARLMKDGGKVVWRVGSNWARS